jgi:hypothetical protein
MSTGVEKELANFNMFVAERLERGEGEISPEQALDLWRAEHPDPDEFGDTVQALREAIADMEAGDSGVPLEQFDQEFRARHNIGRMP